MIAITAQPQPPNYLSRMDERVYSVYIVASRSRTLYIGVTGDLRRRIFQHKWKEYEGFSAKYNCDRLVWFESYQDISAAISRETQLKKWNRAKKLTLIERMNAAWLDLSRDWYECEPADYKRATDGLQSGSKRQTTRPITNPPLSFRPTNGSGAEEPAVGFPHAIKQPVAILPGSRIDKAPHPHPSQPNCRSHQLVASW
jgi:putative endonuclease